MINPKHMDSYTAVAIAENWAGNHYSHAEYVAAWQFLHDTGLAYSLQGWFGRQAQDMLANGTIVDKVTRHGVNTERYSEGPCA